MEFDDAAHLGWYSIGDEATPKGAERKKLLEARAKGTVTSARLQLAALQNSDAHKLADFQARLSGRVLTRLKMNELSFEGFRTALIDPEARVRAVATLPLAVPRVLGMYVSGGFLEANVIRFSDNLNCFIGGRGTGKSTAIRSLAYGLGCRDELEDQENCPDTVIVYCEDGNGILYRYERTRGQAPMVRAKEDQSIKDVPVDAFRVEFYGQGELAEVAKDPLTNASLLQEFLDRHISIRDLREREEALLQELAQNSAQLQPLTASAALLPARRAALQEVDKKLKIAETGKVKEIAGLQTRIAGEKSLVEGLTQVEKFYRTGMTMASFRRDYDALAEAAGTLTGRAECTTLFEQARAAIEGANGYLARQEREINARLKQFAGELSAIISSLKLIHKRFEEELAARVAELQRQGLSGNVKELGDLVTQRTKLAGDITKIGTQGAQLTELEAQRKQLLAEVAAVRDEIMDRRKSQLKAINQNLRQTIEDYSVNLYYDASGVIDEFYALVDRVMHGSYFPADSARSLCSRVSPGDLATLVAAGDLAAIVKAIGITADWARELLKRFGVLAALHELQETAKQPKPVIKVVSKGSSPKDIPITQLSDGQKHTILLTIAMLAESNVPLIIDQPEDDLDNAFIFKSVVATLRAIKERRQVVVVTHNANIAVLGDSELLLPMSRVSGAGKVVDRGSIDSGETRKAVQDILEGGEMAFRRRKEIYGY
jgi:AAA domain, putative AbiEii toxin, Type IV TA system